MDARIDRALIEEPNCSAGDGLHLEHARSRVGGPLLLLVEMVLVMGVTTRLDAIVGRNAAAFYLFRLALPPRKVVVVVSSLRSASGRPGHLRQAAVAPLPQVRSSGSTDLDPPQL